MLPIMASPTCTMEETCPSKIPHGSVSTVTSNHGQGCQCRQSTAHGAYDHKKCHCCQSSTNSCTPATSKPCLIKPMHCPSVSMCIKKEGN